MAQDLAEIVGTALIMLAVDFTELAKKFRSFFELDTNCDFPAMLLMEDKIVSKDEKYNFDIISDSEWKHGKNVQAFYFHSEGVHQIGIKESVYQKARDGDKSALLVIAHEISHWALINICRINLPVLDDGSVQSVVMRRITENLADLLTSLLVTPEKILLENGGERKLLCSALSQKQTDFASFYSQNIKFLQAKVVEEALKAAKRQGGKQIELKEAMAG